MSRTAVLYCRISRDPRDSLRGVDRQEFRLREMAEELGLDIAGVFVDNDLSAFSGKPRPKYDAMMRLLPEVDVLLVAAPDRLTRHPRELEDLIDRLEDASVDVRTAIGGVYDLNSPHGRAAARQAGTQARLESEIKSFRLRELHADKLRRGESAGGGRAFGFKVGNSEIDPVEAGILREMVDRYLSGASMSSIARWLQSEDISTPRGGRFTTTTIRNILGNPRIAGIRTATERTKDGRRRDRREVREAAWDGIIPIETFRRLEARLALSGGRSRPPANLLTGLLVCGRCGTLMVASRRAASAGGERVYSCDRRTATETGCRRNSILAEPLEDEIVAALLRRSQLLEPRAASSSALREATEELELIAAERRRIGQLAARGMSDEAIIAAEEEFAARKRAAELIIRRESETGWSPEEADRLRALPEMWDRPEFGAAKRREFAARLIESIEIGPFDPRAKGFNLARIGTPVWRSVKG